MRHSVAVNSELNGPAAVTNQQFRILNSHLYIQQLAVMTVQLSAEEQLKFSAIMFQAAGEDHQQIQNLTTQEKSKLKSMYAQKIAYDIANANMKQEAAQTQQSKASPSGIISTICCCFLPEENKDKFDITSAVFLKRIFSTLLFFKSDFLAIDGGKAQLYGFLWLTITYVIILGLAANMNEYFILPNNYAFSNLLLLKAFGVSAIFLISEPFLYAAVVKSLEGSIPTIESFMLTGYSTALYFVPTFLCLIPSLYWHVGMLAAGSLVRSVFLFRNYGSKIPSKSFAILIVILLVETLFVFVVMRVLFENDNGYSFSDGTSKVFNNHALRQFIE